MKKRMLCLAAAVFMMVPFSAITAFAEKPSGLSWESEETVAPGYEVSMINGFGEFDIQDHYLYLTEDEKWDEEKLIAQMPETLEVYLDNAAETVSIPVSWYCVGDNFDTDLYYYQFSPCFDPELYKLNPSIDLLKDAPYIGVFVGENKNYQSYALDNASAGKGVTGIANETRIFEYLTKEKGINVAAACGILVNLYAESSFMPNNLQNSFEGILGYTDVTYTEAVDSGEYTNFTGDSAGYGICQWSISSRKSKLLAYAQSRGTSIADLEMQLDFMIEEVKSNSTVYRHITNAELTGDGAYDVAYYWCYYFEVPANKEKASVSRGNLAKDTYWEYYKQFVDFEDPEPGDSIAEEGYTGLTEYNNELYYAKEGVWDDTYTGFAVYDDNCYYVQDGYVDQSRTGFVEQDGSTYYIEGGRTKPEYTGIIYFENKGYYLVDGIWQSDFSSLVLDNGIWYYIENGMLAEDYTGLVKYYSTWYYVERGVLNWNYTGLTQYYSTWYYVEKGVLNWNYTGLTQYYSTWYYVEKGVLNWNYTGLTQYYSTWYYVERGVLNWNYTGLTQYYSTWYYVEKGVLNWNYTGLTQYYSTWYYVEKGVLNWNYTGLTQYYGTWYYVEKGVLNWNYTGLAENKNGWWYCVNGKVDFSYNGTVSYNGKKWLVVNGKATVISGTNPYSEISDIKKA